MMSLSSGGDYDKFIQKMRYWVLFWDKFVISNQGNARLNNEFLFLKDEGLLEILRVNHPGGEMALVAADCHRAMLTHLEEREPGIWAYAQGVGTFEFEDGDLLNPDNVVRKRGLTVSLTNCIPVPDRSIPLDDIMEFKRKRSEELFELRYHIDQLYQKISKSEDVNFVYHSERQNLERSIGNYIKTIRERKFPFRLTSEVASVNLVAGSIAAIASASMPLTTMLSNVAAASLATNISLGWNKRPSSSPFRYVASFHSELFN